MRPKRGDRGSRDDVDARRVAHVELLGKCATRREPLEFPALLGLAQRADHAVAARERGFGDSTAEAARTSGDEPDTRRSSRVT